MVVSRVYNEIGFNFRSLNNYLVGTVEQLPIWLLFAVGVSFRFGRPNLNCGFWLSHVSPILSFFFFGVLLWFSLKNFEFGRRKVTWTHFIWKCSRDETQRNSPIFLSLSFSLSVGLRESQLQSELIEKIERSAVTMWTDKSIEELVKGCWELRCNLSGTAIEIN